MAPKSKTGEKEETKRKVKVEKLKLNKETVRDLTERDAKKVRGGRQQDDPAGRAVKDTLFCP